jgi:hypothetical protein
VSEATILAFLARDLRTTAERLAPLASSKTSDAKMV